MKKLPRGGWFGRGYGAFGWGRSFGNPYPFCRWFPWLPRWWWTGIYGPLTPFTWQPTLPKEQEIAFLEDQKKLIEKELSQINKRLEEIKKEGAS